MTPRKERGLANVRFGQINPASRPLVAATACVMSATVASWEHFIPPRTPSAQAEARRFAKPMSPSSKPAPTPLQPRSATDPRSDESLMEAFAEGEAEAFDHLVRRHSRGLYNFLLRSVQSAPRAEELLQDVLVRVIRSKHRYRRSAKFTTWMYTIARNLCVDESRRARFRDHESLEAPRGPDGSRSLLSGLQADAVPTDARAEAVRLRSRMALAVSRLPRDQREVFLMRQLGGLSFREIGDAVGAPENTVKSRMRYALEKLRGELSELHASIVSPRAKPGAHGREGWSHG